MRKFTLRLNSAKNTDYIEKCFVQKLRRIKFLTKNSLNTYIFPCISEVEVGGAKDLRYWNIMMHWYENVLKIFLKTHGIASYNKNFSSGSKDIWHLSVISQSLFVGKVWYFFSASFKFQKRVIFTYIVAITVYNYA